MKVITTAIKNEGGSLMTRTLMMNDLKAMKRDPMLMMVLAMPFLMILVFHLAINLLSFLVPFKTAFIYLFANLMPMTAGGILGLQILEDKDQQLLRFYAVTPLTLKGYFLYKGIVTFLITFLGTAIIYIGITGQIPLEMVFYEALIGVLCTFGMGKIAKNKVQGMVLFKPMDSLALLPCMRLLGDNRYDKLLKLLPWDYTYQVEVMHEQNLGVYLIYLLVVICLILVIVKHLSINDQ